MEILLSVFVDKGNCQLRATAYETAVGTGIRNPNDFMESTSRPGDGWEEEEKVTGSYEVIFSSGTFYLILLSDE